MKKKLFGNNIKPSCKYCALGTALGDDKIQCSKFGVVKSYDSCKKFEYSPLKRIPKKEIQLANSEVNNINFWWATIFLCKSAAVASYDRSCGCPLFIQNATQVLY